MAPDDQQDDRTKSFIALTKGSMIDHYRIVKRIGSGGMGEVYLADDSKLNRQVALKFLLPYLCQDEDGRMRFKREAQAAASLSHANIVTIYEVSEHEGRPFIAMEYLEGEPLRNLISKGDLKLERVISLISQVCGGLATAHQTGIVHRDIKPSNVYVVPEDCAKILDFGLAASECFEQITRTGSTLGTVDYMSPEQARGDTIDQRSDLFSVGVMLYELITGIKPFRRDNQIATLHAIATDDPEPLARYKSRVPAELQRIVSKLLAKKPAERYHHADEVAVDLRAIDLGPTAHGISQSRPKPWGAVREFSRASLVVPWLIAIIALSLLGWQLLEKPSEIPPRTINLPVAIPRGYTLVEGTVNQIAVSPLGDRWVTRVVDSTSVGCALLWEAGRPEPRTVSGTENGRSFCFSPDGKWLLFFADGRLRKLHLAGGEPIDLCEGVGFGADWTEDDTIYFCRDLYSGIWKIAAAGGEPEQVTKVQADEFAHWSPEVLPGGAVLLHTVWKTSLRDISTHIVHLKTGDSRSLVDGGAHARLLPTGQLVYIRRGTLMAAPFDIDLLEITGWETPIVAQIYQQPGVGLGNYSFSRDGFFVYLAGTMDEDAWKLVWVDQEGRITPLPFAAGSYYNLSLSPAETHLAYDRSKDGVTNIWIMELTTCRSSQLTFESDNFEALWHPSGKRVAFSTYRNGPFSVYEIPVDRSSPERPVMIRDVDVIAETYTPDGERLVVSTTGKDGFGDLLLLRTADTSQIEPLAVEPYDQKDPKIHPSGKWVAYSSSESGHREVYVRPLGRNGSIVQVSVNGGKKPLWSRDGGKLYYWRGQDLMAVKVQVEPRLHAGEPEKLFDVPNDIGDYDVASDGRFIMVQGSPSSKPQLIAVTNWFEEVKRLNKGDR